ncbi:HD-GYP domain, c-di-GMP phosphodiesterase class II (or its inactivated variant) [Kushneria avicenniae]|uniref:HD-GYP domain, c-di-GMP phosphodiesterase class II (Or its inactivated variant) n=1 Tax=Kushneria avicenniae TaxID=402385 RepID=A0A1I1IEB1_9GAMM|nr:HD domain-containing phosphohydrolase [Kushneria avicenniae]SFC34576.1 HD-GYP domain, c-di-GMP phosphodiesterase class II (or its inactivated variant) [Kushneria avicenniae]
MFPDSNLNSSKARHLDINAPDQIVETFADLTGHDARLSIRFEGLEVQYPVTLALLDRDLHQCVLRASDLTDLNEHLSQRLPFYLEIQHTSMSMTSALMRPLKTSGQADWVDIRAALPVSFKLTRQRNLFRATLERGMKVNMLMTAQRGGNEVEGRLVDLSIGGCLIAVSVNDAIHFQIGMPLYRLRAVFPSSEAFDASGCVRHMRCSDNSGDVMVGVVFDASLADFERQVWFYVREIEREAVRLEAPPEREVAPSRLFNEGGAAIEVEAIATPQEEALATLPLFDNVKNIARALGVQLINLQAGMSLETAVLSEQARRLLALLQEDRQALLYALACVERHSTPLVCHGMTVAARLADLESGARTTEQIVQMMACAMVHDFGKILLPEQVRLHQGSMDAATLFHLHPHVELLRFRIERDAFAADVRRDVLLSINERLDGSGYPRGLDGHSMSRLARMAAVVDAIDAMGRPRSDRPAWLALDIYRHIFNAGSCFDTGCVNRYVKRYGFTPIGSLVAFSSGFQGWVMRLDGKGQPSRVRVVRELTHDKRMDQVLEGADLVQLGTLEGCVGRHDSAMIPW